MTAIEELNGEKILDAMHCFEKILPKTLEYQMFFKKRKNLLNLLVILKQKNYPINYIYINSRSRKCLKKIEEK